MHWLPLTHLLALALLAYQPFFWIREDAAAIAANGAADTLHEAFHAKRLSWRIEATLLVCVLASLPAHGHRWAVSVSIAGLLCFGAAWFAYIFNPGLSKARGKAPYYVSFDPRAARFPDSWLAGRACRALPGLSLAPGRAAHAARELRQLLTAALIAGLLAYLTSLASLCLLLR